MLFMVAILYIILLCTSIATLVKVHKRNKNTQILVPYSSIRNASILITIEIISISIITALYGDKIDKILKLGELLSAESIPENARWLAIFIIIGLIIAFIAWLMGTMMIVIAGIIMAVLVIGITVVLYCYSWSKRGYKVGLGYHIVLWVVAILSLIITIAMIALAVTIIV